jgi:hypothetical protein
LLDRLTSLCKEHYGKRLISLVVFGSVGRGTPRPDSDIDLLLVVKDLPDGRMARVKEFVPIEMALLRFTCASLAENFCRPSTSASSASSSGLVNSVNVPERARSST